MIEQEKILNIPNRFDEVKCNMRNIDALAISVLNERLGLDEAIEIEHQEGEKIPRGLFIGHLDPIGTVSKERGRLYIESADNFFMTPLETQPVGVAASLVSFLVKNGFFKER